jgi:hypothetical protein
MPQEISTSHRAMRTRHLASMALMMVALSPADSAQLGLMADMVAGTVAGTVALGLVALGLVALGLMALGLVALGLMALGLVALGLMALGLVAPGPFLGTSHRATCSARPETSWAASSRRLGTS